MKKTRQMYLHIIKVGEGKAILSYIKHYYSK